MKKIIYIIVFIYVISLVVNPVGVSAGNNELTGFLYTTTANTLALSEFKVKAYTNILTRRFFELDFNSMLDDMVSNVGVSMMYGLSEVSEVALSLLDVMPGSELVIPEVRIHGKFNILPGVGIQGLGLGGYISFSDYQNLQFGYQIYGTFSTVLENVVVLALQLGLIEETYLNMGIMTSPYEDFGIVFEVSFAGNNSMIIPGIRIGSSEEFEAKIGIGIPSGDLLGVSDYQVHVMIEKAFR